MAEAGMTGDELAPAERPAGQEKPPADPFAELAALWAKVDPEKPNQSFRGIRCLICGAFSGWADVWAPGSKGAQVLTEWKFSHTKATAGAGTFGPFGHSRWYEFDISRRIENRV